MIDGIIYKLFCKDADEFYVGSSTEFHQRKIKHKSCCNNVNRKNYNYPVYKYIRNNGGYDKFDYEILELGEYEDKNCMKNRERYFIETLKPSLNSYIPNRTKKEYCDDNKDIIKQYYQNNIEEINERRKEKITCEICNCKIARNGLGKHKKTKKHIRNLNITN